MAEALVSVLLERLATLSIEKIQRELHMVIGVEQEVKKLTKKLEAIRTVLEDAEQRQEMDPSIKLWLNELKEVSYDMDDVLDEWITRILRHQLENHEAESGNALATTSKKKVCFPFPSSCFRSSSKQDNKLFLRRKIKELNERLSIIDYKRSFGFQTTTRVHELPQRQKTTSLPNVKTFGRDDEKNLLVSKLLSESSEENEVPLIIPIVGMGGMGKTSLAKFVYNDERVKSHFDKRIWVCVSDPFEEIKICKAIIESLLDRENGSNELETLMNIINESIRGKKFLLVLDDVWSPKLSQWEKLIKPLRNATLGSRVLVTTRREEVVTLMKATNQMIHLKALGETFCLSLFYHSAGINEGSLSNELHHIGLEIVKKCNGLPLAAAILGSLMRNKKNIHEWQAILKSMTWESKDIQRDIFRPLLLSYYNLSPTVKRCILYCVIFPKDYVFEKSKLIELWMAQDYLGVKESKKNITLGQNYFNDLIMRSFFQDRKEEYGETTCKIHDIVHDFLQYLIKNECLILDFKLDASKRMKEAPNDKVYHLTIVHASESESLIHFLRNNKKIRSLIAIDLSNNFLSAICELMVHLKSLRTLNLFGSNRGSIVRIPEGIGELLHLRYIDLSYHTKFTELPDTIGGLYNLQTLRLVGCHSLQRLDVRRLINLKHLYVYDCFVLRLIKGIEKLTDLQRLDEFRVGDGVSVNKLEDLKNLNQLQGRLTIKNVRHGNSAEEAIMVNKPHMSHLGLEFRDNYPEQLSTLEKDREILDGLEPHPCLESLTINGYGGTTLSTWISSLNYLTQLTLECCCDCEFFPTLGILASLESLYMGSFYVIKVGVEFLGIDESKKPAPSAIVLFPRLRQLSINNMLFWEEWEGVEARREGEISDDMTIMPCLTSLEISNCNYLKALPDFLWETPLQKLHITGSSNLENLYREGTGEQWVKISHIPSIKLGNACIMG